MTYQPPRPQRDPGMTFLGMSGGILFLSIAAVIVLPILCCVGMFFAGVIGVASTDPSPSPSHSARK